MSNYELKGMLNQHLRIENDRNNLVNSNNSVIFSQILKGNEKSAEMDYLLNLGFMRLSDVRSISQYNETNLAAKINTDKGLEEIFDSNTIYLPQKMKKLKKSFSEVIEQRHSSREFEHTKMSLEELSCILKNSFGLAKRQVNYNGIITTTRHYASGGGLYPIDVYLMINQVKQLKKGLYKYQPYSHSLFQMHADMDLGILFATGHFDLENCSFVVLYEYSVNRNYTKYGELSLLTSMVEVGNMSHNFELTCAASDYSACQIAGFDKPYAEKCLGLDGINSHVIFTNICGKE